MNESKSAHHERICARLDSAFSVLLEAVQCAEDVGSDRWDFAVTFKCLAKQGLGETDLRWLVKRGYADHAREVTVKGDDGRQFRSAGDLTFSRRSCFVLTDLGVAKAQAVVKRQELQDNNSSSNGESRRRSAQSCVPYWDSETRELLVDNKIVKQFRWQAINQEVVLSAFQEEGWPAVISDPLPPKPEQESKRRLQDTIKALNRNQEYPVIRFRGNGTGEGIRWESIG